MLSEKRRYEERYSKLKTIGRGSFGRAVLVHDNRLNRRAVAKEILVENATALEAAQGEARSLQRAIGNKYILELYDVARVSKNQINIVTEYCTGGDLQEQIKRRKESNHRYSESDIWSVAAQLAQALGHLHDKGMLHRDVKTANVFLTSLPESEHHSGDLCNTTPRVKLGDFGIAKVMPYNSAEVSERRCKTPIGTPMYVSPEVCFGKNYGPKADLWALGCVLHEMAALQPAFEASSLERLFSKIKMGWCSTTSLIPSCYSQALKSMIKRLLTIDAHKRIDLNGVMKEPCILPFIDKEPSKFPPLEMRKNEPKNTGGLARGHTRTRSLDIRRLQRQHEGQQHAGFTQSTKWILPETNAISNQSNAHGANNYRLGQSNSAPNSPAPRRRHLLSAKPGERRLLAPLSPRSRSAVTQSTPHNPYLTAPSTEGGSGVDKAIQNRLEARASAKRSHLFGQLGGTGTGSRLRH